MKQKQAHLSRLGTGLFSFLCIVYVLHRGGANELL